MADGARAYYMDAHSATSLTPEPKQLPGPSIGPTPALGTCCKTDGKCAPDATLWTAQPLVALMFSVDDPHYFSYEYKVAADHTSATVSAYGDLDCDGDYSTFSMTVTIAAEGAPESSELKRTKELE